MFGIYKCHFIIIFKQNAQNPLTDNQITVKIHTVVLYKLFISYFSITCVKLNKTTCIISHKTHNHLALVHGAGHFFEISGARQGRGRADNSRCQTVAFWSSSCQLPIAESEGFCLRTNRYGTPRIVSVARALLANVADIAPFDARTCSPIAFCFLFVEYRALSLRYTCAATERGRGSGRTRPAHQRVLLYFVRTHDESDVINLAILTCLRCFKSQVNMMRIANTPIA